MMIWILQILVLITHADTACPKAQEWKEVGRVEGKFFQKQNHYFVAYEKRESQPMVIAQAEAALALMKKGKCLDVVYGFRKSGAVRTPHGVVEMSKVTLTQDWDALRVNSTFAHGFTETLSTIFVYREKEGIWPAGEWVTLEVSPSGDEASREMKTLDLNADSYTDVRLDNEQWLFNPGEFIYQFKK